jgi:uncharacterized small protein (DUF1192 family)
MPKAKHFKAAAFVNSQLFAGLTSFAQLETRIAALPDEKARGDAFEVFAEAYPKPTLPRNASTMPRTFGRMARCRSPEPAGIFSTTNLARRKFEDMKAIPLEIFSSAIVREILHAV